MHRSVPFALKLRDHQADQGGDQPDQGRDQAAANLEHRALQRVKAAAESAQVGIDSPEPLVDPTFERLSSPP